MADKQKSKIYIKRDKQPISIPFIWEEKPGTPKKDWKPTSPPINPVTPPVKLVVSIPFEWEEKPGTPLPYYALPYEERDGFSDSCSNETYDCFSSAPSILANGQEMDNSYEMGSTRFASAAFLEWLFPLLVPNSSFRCLEKYSSHREDLKESRVLAQESDSSRVKRPLLTLGELIVMSRRMSCRRKVVKINKQQSMDFMKGGIFGCFTFGSGNGV